MAKVALMMGSDSDLPKLESGIKLLKEFGIEYQARVLSAHRTPGPAREFVEKCEADGVQVFICAAGVAAHLAGAVAAHTQRPVIGIPVSAGPLDGLDALLSTVQMPPGVPVATVAIDGSKNAAVLAAQMIGLAEPEIAAKVVAFRKAQTENVGQKDARLQEKIANL